MHAHGISAGSDLLAQIASLRSSQQSATAASAAASAPPAASTSTTALIGAVTGFTGSPATSDLLATLLSLANGGEDATQAGSPASPSPAAAYGASSGGSGGTPGLLQSLVSAIGNSAITSSGAGYAGGVAATLTALGGEPDADAPDGSTNVADAGTNAPATPTGPAARQVSQALAAYASFANAGASTSSGLTSLTV